MQIILDVERLLRVLSGYGHGLIFLWFGFTSYQLVRRRDSNLGKPLLVVFIALTIDRLWSVVINIRVPGPPIPQMYPIEVFLARDIIHIIVLGSLIYLMVAIFKLKKES